MPRISVVVTGYRRPDELRQTIESFLAVNTYPEVELVLADDGSPPEMQAEMRGLPFDRFVLAQRNRGLGGNTNAGLAAADGEYVLQLQDDWYCDGPPDFLQQGVALLQARPDVGLVRFADYGPGCPEYEMPYELQTTPSGLPMRLYRPLRRSRLFVYSDWPHLKSREFIAFMGPYKEHHYMQKTEADMRNRFNAQDRYSVAFIEGYDLFSHIGAEVSHRPQLPLTRIASIMDSLPLARTAAAVYRRGRDAIRGREGS